MPVGSAASWGAERDSGGNCAAAWDAALDTVLSQSAQCVLIVRVRRAQEVGGATWGTTPMYTPLVMNVIVLTSYLLLLCDCGGRARGTR